MEILSTIFSLVLIVFIVSMMLAAGLSATVASLGRVFRKFWLVILVLVVNFVLVPLLGWGIAELFALTTPAFIALVLIACSPGAPFGVKVVVTAGGDVVTASSLQILIAVLGSFTFPITANWILSVADLGEGISLPVGRLVLTIVVLQIIPFIVGMAVRNWAPQAAGGWLKSSMKVSGMTLLRSAGSRPAWRLAGDRGSDRVEDHAGCSGLHRHRSGGRHACRRGTNQDQDHGRHTGAEPECRSRFRRGRDRLRERSRHPGGRPVHNDGRARRVDPLRLLLGPETSDR